MEGVKNKKTSKIMQRNEKIRKRFAVLTDEKHFNSDYALSILENEFLPLERDTIWLIIRKTGHYKNL